MNVNIEKKLRIEHVNVRSIIKNFDEVKNWMTSKQTDILTVSETWLDEQTPDSFVNIEGYKLYRKDYIHSKIGGVAIYVRNELTSNEVHFDINAPIDMEAIFVKVQYCKNPSILISSMYRHPHGKKDTYDFIETALNKMLKQNVQFYVLGDLNDNQIKSVNPKSPLKAIMYKNGLHQLIETPTRVTSSTTSLIDVIITNKRDGVTWENSECSIADHNIITVIANMKKPKRNPITCTFRCMKNYSKEHFCAVLSENIGALNNIYNTDNVDEQVRIFTKVFQESLEKCAPIVTRNLKRPPAPWLTEEVRTKMSERDHLLRIFRQNVSEIAAQRAYQNSKKEVKRLVKKAKKQHYQSRLKDNKGNLKAIWKIVNEIIPRKSQNHDPSSGLPDMQKIANDFNAFFSSIGKNTYNEVKKSDMDKNKNCDKENFKHCTKLPKINSLNNLFRPKPITPQGLIVIINNLHNTNSVGHDGIALKYLKDSSNIMYKYLLTIINTSINTGVCPKQWKEAIVKPLHKNGDSSLPSNFRPISLLPILSKILEKAVADQLIMYLESNNLISNCQYGYRHHLSTELALLKITEEVYKAIENKEICLLTLLDLSKAFDTVNPELLLRKLLEINVSTFWFENYLSGRTQSVKLNNTTSHQNVIEFGVPQGSILGPILFLIYINDIVKNLRNCIVVMYADDIQLIHKGKLGEIENIIKNTEENLNRLKRRYDYLGLKINANKTQCMFVGSPFFINKINNNLRLNFDGHKIAFSDNVKTLGVIFDKFLSFEKHVNDLCRKTKSTLIYIQRMQHKLDLATRTMVVDSLVLSKLNYCPLIWGRCNDSLIKDVQTVQNFAAKVACGGGKKSDKATPFRKKLNWLTVKNNLKLTESVFVFKVINTQIPKSCGINFPTNNTRNIGCFLRNNDNLAIPLITSRQGRRSIMYTGPLLWNSMPQNIRSLTSVSSFKANVKKLLLSQEN
ncbi:unnamed protein product [Rotaria magnacalcarata]|uniref:Reverse transcriptase domain-containing protein n=1 Tax=Rotaria magnacalcarata TaxID=392030 RepID=A0A820ABF9_9BILA|nr:unnamed protein product [Rotaria magnacalcarata]CAF4186740.1 unnamed protein product [Rotaria magnacalcarata]